MSKKWQVVVTSLVKLVEMDQEDQECFNDIVGSHEYYGPDADSVLDRFHADTPISCLDNFNIEIYEV